MSLSKDRNYARLLALRSTILGRSEITTQTQSLTQNFSKVKYIKITNDF